MNHSASGLNVGGFGMSAGLPCGAPLSAHRTIVLISSSEVYGTAEYSPMDEQHPLNAQSPYAATKIGADQVTIKNHSAIFLSPQQAKALLNVLGQNLAQYEQAFGTLNIEPQVPNFPQGPIH